MEEMKQSLRELITAAYAPRSRVVEQMGSGIRKNNMMFVSGSCDFLGPELGDRRFFVIDQPACTASGRVVPTRHPTPPVGTPAAGRHGGNSAPAIANVRGPQKSERTGERCGLEVNDGAAARGAE